MTTSPLKGLRILNTRPVEHAQELSQAIIAAGGISLECPVLEIQKIQESWINTLPDLSRVSHAIFISSNAVYYTMSAVHSHNIAWPSSIQNIAIGDSTANTLHQMNRVVHQIPIRPDSEHVLNIPSLQEIKNQTILLFKGEGGRTLIEEGLVQRGAHVIPISTYKRVLPKLSQEFINSLWQDELVDIILLTSEQAIQNLFKLFNKASHSWIRDTPCLVISERLAKSASLFSIKNIIISHPHRIVNTLLDHYQGLIHGSENRRTKKPTPKTSSRQDSRTTGQKR